jgi:hypothetical protein
MRALTDHSPEAKEGTMRNIPDPKTMAKALRKSLSQRQIDIPHSAALEIIAAQFGLDSWNVLAAPSKDAALSEGVQFQRTSPVIHHHEQDWSHDHPDREARRLGA